MLRPSWRDPRVPFAAVLTLYCVLGVTVLGFNRSSGQMLAILASGCLVDVMLARFVKGTWIIPLSGYISSCSLALLLNYSHHSALLFWPVLLAIGSKYVLTHNGRHVFNPSMFGVATSLLLSDELITAAPAYQWAGGTLGMSAFVLMAALVLFIFRIQRVALVASFLIFYALQTGLRAYLTRHHLPPAMLFWGTVTSPPFFIFVFYMLTDPATSARTPRGQVLFSFVFAVIDLYLHTKESVFTFFYTALIMATGKFAYLHGRSLWQERARYVVRFGRAYARALMAVAVAALSIVAATHRARVVTPSFQFERIDVTAAGISARPSDLLERVDARVQHIAKWILSVGDAVAVGDYDNDGLPDLFLTHVLKHDDDRAALYRNLGDFKFARIQVGALERFRADHARYGLPGGATFVDYDGDGDLDLAVAVAFGASRLLRNALVETGTAAFDDVTEAAGLGFHGVSLALAFFDFNRDGRLDLLHTNVMAPYLRDYAQPTPLNVFALPPPEYAGDRRMLRFMHDGWHDAANGGPNILLLGETNGTFRAVPGADTGLVDTRWSLAAATADFNRDGFTDLYVANDFGPDELYVSQRGKRFQQVRGLFFGEVGRDTYKGMNASVADFDRNGLLDVYVSNVHHALQAEGSLLWMTSRDADGVVFRDEATQRGALNERRFGWGAAAGDLDLDGWPDLVQANGMVDDRLDGRDFARKDYWYVNHKLMQSGPDVHTYADMWGDIRGRTLYANEGRRAYLNRGGEFVDVAEAIGIDDPDNSRGVAFADFDNDGDLDVVITNQHGTPSLYRNTARRQGGPNFVGLALIGDGATTHRTAIGSQVELRCGGDTQLQEVTLLTGFSGQSDGRLLFGLGNYAAEVEATIHWYGGTPQTLRLAPNRYHTIRQAPSSEHARR